MTDPYCVYAAEPLLISKWYVVGGGGIGSNAQFSIPSDNLQIYWSIIFLKILIWLLDKLFICNSYEWTLFSLKFLFYKSLGPCLLKLNEPPFIRYQINKTPNVSSLFYFIIYF